MVRRYLRNEAAPIRETLERIRQTAVLAALAKWVKG